MNTQMKKQKDKYSMFWLSWIFVIMNLMRHRAKTIFIILVWPSNLQNLPLTSTLKRTFKCKKCRELWLNGLQRKFHIQKVSRGPIGKNNLKWKPISDFVCAFWCVISVVSALSRHFYPHLQLAELQHHSRTLINLKCSDQDLMAAGNKFFSKNICEN